MMKERLFLLVICLKSSLLEAAREEDGSNSIFLRSLGTKGPKTPTENEPSPPSPSAAPEPEAPGNEPTSPSTTKVPYDLARFRSIFDSSRLQYPGSSTAIRKGHFPDKKLESFDVESIDGKDYLRLSFDHAYPSANEEDSTRCELRHEQYFSTADELKRELKATMQIPKPGPTISAFTIFQVHSRHPDTGDGFIKGPLLRIVWSSTKSEKEDWLWVNIRTAYPDKRNTYVPLCPRPDGFFDMSIVFENYKLKVTLNDEEKFSKDNMKYWAPVTSNRFKAGVYMHNGGENGEGKVLYDKLEFNVPN